ncbi:MAG: lasso peptide biosynthesis PqqD family chaperone [Pseudonocardia sp.]
MSLRLHYDVSTATTVDGIVLLNERSGRYWQLNQSGSATLRSLLNGDSPATAAQNLAATYDISLARAAADVDALVAALRTAALVIS